MWGLITLEGATRTVYFSRIKLNPHSSRKEIIRYFSRDHYGEHQELWKFFSGDPNAKRNFLFYKEKNIYYVVSKQPPVASDDLKILWSIDGPKEYKPSLEKRQKLFFKLRFNPIVTKDKKRIDVVTYKKMQLNYRTLPQSEKPSLNDLTTEACVEWLNKRMEHHGFSFNHSEVTVHSYQRKRAWKKQHSITYYSVDIEGILTVVDIDKFKNMLFNGIGKERAFGCGLMLIKKL